MGLRRVFEGVSKGFEGIQGNFASPGSPDGWLGRGGFRRNGHYGMRRCGRADKKAALLDWGGLTNLVFAPCYLGGYRVTSSSLSLCLGCPLPPLLRGRPAPRPAGRPARGTASSSRRSGRACGRTSREFGSPPCSPQMPSLMPGRVSLPFSTAIFISWPTPAWSIEAKGFVLMISFS